jgi:hypothetical protein
MAHEGTHLNGNRYEGMAHLQGLETYNAINAKFGLEADGGFYSDMALAIMNPESWVENTGDVDFWLLRVEIKDGRLKIGLKKDQETDTLCDLAARLAGSNNGWAYLAYQKILMTDVAGIENDLQYGDELDLTGIIAYTMDFENDATRLFQNSSLPQYLNDKFPGVDFTKVELHKFNLPPFGLDEDNSNAWPNNTIGVGRNNYPEWMATLNTLSIANGYGFNIDAKSLTGKVVVNGESENVNFQSTIGYILHENMHLAQFKQMGTLPFVSRYVDEILFNKYNYDNYNDPPYFMSEQMSLNNIIANPAGKYEIINNPNLKDNYADETLLHYKGWTTRYNKDASSETNPPLNIKVGTTLDSRADAFGYWGTKEFLEKYGKR